MTRIIALNRDAALALAMAEIDRAFGPGEPSPRAFGRGDVVRVFSILGREPNVETPFVDVVYSEAVARVNRTLNGTWCEIRRAPLDAVPIDELEACRKIRGWIETRYVPRGQVQEAR